MLRTALLMMALATVACEVSPNPVGRTGSPQESASVSSTPGLADTQTAFEIEGMLGSRDMVLVQPMLEADVAVSLRAEQAGVDPSTIEANVHGLKFFVVHRDPEVGTASFRRSQVYHHLNSGSQLTVDNAYWYVSGFISTDIIKVQVKYWSNYYRTSPDDIAKLKTLAEAVRNGTGHKEAYQAFGSPFSGSLGDRGPDQNRLEREVTWFAGVQAIDGVGVEVMRSPELGNRIAVRFAK